MTIVSVVAWISVFLLGIAFLQFLCAPLRPVLKVGFAMPVGMGLTSWYMFLLDLAGILVNNSLVLVGGVLVLGCVFLLLAYRRQGRISAHPRVLFQGMSTPGWDIAYYMAVLLILAVLAVISIKALLWPVVNYDSVAGYDLLGKIIAAEGTLDNTVYDKVNSLESTRTGYPPFYPYTLAFARITGAVNPKITCIFFFVPLAVCFYQLLRTYITPLGSAIFTLLLISAPDFADFSSLSSNNLPLAFFAGLGFICIYLWYDKGLPHYFRLGTVLMSFSMWDRMEAIFFVLPAALIIGIPAWKSKSIKNLLIFCTCTFAPLIIWQLYMHLLLDAVSRVNVRMYLFWDLEKLQVMARQVSDTTFSTVYWGIVIYASLVLIAINLLVTLIKRQKEKWLFLIGVAIAWLLYLVLFYQMDVNFEAVGWLLYSYKRGLYTYLPPLLFGVAILYVTQFCFGFSSMFRTTGGSSIHHSQSK